MNLRQCFSNFLDLSLSFAALESWCATRASVEERLGARKGTCLLREGCGESAPRCLVFDFTLAGSRGAWELCHNSQQKGLLKRRQDLLDGALCSRSDFLALIALSNWWLTEGYTLNIA